MKKCLLLFLTLTLMVSVVQADETACPARRAAEKGFQAIEEFHKILGPTWHRAWPNKDYNALLAAGPKFEEAFKGIAELEMIFKSEKREKAYTESRDEFAKLVKQYAEICRAGEKEKAYDLMPTLHDAFEMTASAMLPVHYPQFDGFVITMNMIVETHLPENNMEGVVGSTETLVAKAEALTEETIPDDLKEKQKEIMVDLAAIKELTARAKECCDKSDMDNYMVHIDKLNTQVNEFIRKYI